MKESSVLVVICSFAAGVCAMGLAYDLNMDCKVPAPPAHRYTFMPAEASPETNALVCTLWLATGRGGESCG